MAKGAGFLAQAGCSSPPPQPAALQPAVMKSLAPSQPAGPAGLPASPFPLLPRPSLVLTSHLAKKSEKPLTLPDPEFIDWSGPTCHTLVMRERPLKGLKSPAPPSKTSL